jgi:6-phosphogluconate dehydrogenase
MTTSKPDLAKRIAKELESVGCHGLDAPVSGGDIGAKEGRLAIMVGGDQAAFNKVKDILKCMGNPEKGGKVELLGPPGSGQHTKMTNQILISTTMIGVVEGIIRNFTGFFSSFKVYFFYIFSSSLRQKSGPRCGKDNSSRGLRCCRELEFN